MEINCASRLIWAGDGGRSYWNFPENAQQPRPVSPAQQTPPHPHAQNHGILELENPTITALKPSIV